MVLNRQRRVPVALDPLKQFAERARRELRFADDAVTVCLVSDAAIARLNRQYRGKRGPTDVLSFPAAAQGARAPFAGAPRAVSARTDLPPRASTPRNGSPRKTPSGHRIEGFQEGTASAVPNRATKSGALAPRANAVPYAGDIAISPSAARRNARRLDRTLPAELRVLILHGMLHLAGYDHETDRGEMDRIERRLRRRLGVG
jgi:rRNA maturation RNase YbeY